MPAYVIAEVEVLNPAEYERYRQRVPATIEKYGGRFIARGGRVEVLESDWQPHRMVIIEFASVERAREWYHSPDYQEVLPIRQRNSRAGFVAIVEGV